MAHPARCPRFSTITAESIAVLIDAFYARVRRDPALGPVFEATAAEVFAPELAAVFAAKARRIATSLRLALFHRLDRPPEGLRRSRRTAA